MNIILRSSDWKIKSEISFEEFKEVAMTGSNTVYAESRKSRNTKMIFFRPEKLFAFSGKCEASELTPHFTMEILTVRHGLDIRSEH